MRSQTRLTEFFLTTDMPHSSQSPSVLISAPCQPALSMATLRMPLPAISMVSSRVPSSAISVASSRVPSTALSRALLIVPLMGPSSYPPSSHGASPVGLDQGGSGSDGNGDVVDSGGE